MIVKCIIEETTSIKVSSLTLSSNDIKPHGKEGKLNRVDFHVIDEDGRHYDIEMENGPYNEENNVCFETYACKLISSQETRIKDYDTIDSVYQIVFFKGRKATDNTRMIERYCVYDTENLTQFETILYIFQNNLTDDMLKVESEAVEYMAEEYRKI